VHIDSKKNPNVRKSFFNFSMDKPNAATAIDGSTNCFLSDVLIVDELLFCGDHALTFSMINNLCNALS
jgi:hypothetical protein